MRLRTVIQAVVFVALIGNCSSYGHPFCPSGVSLAQLVSFLDEGPCSLGNGITMYGPVSFQSSVMPLGVNHPHILASDVTILFGYNLTNPPTITMVAQCAKCAVTGMQSSQIEIGAYLSGEFPNFGALLANWAPTYNATAPDSQPKSSEACMPFTELDAELGAGNGDSIEVVRTAVTYQHTQISSFVPTWQSLPTPQPVTLNLMQSSFSCSYTVSYAATVYLSQPKPVH